MGTKIKTVLKGFDYMHCDDFALYLSKMAAKGWHFKEWGIGLKFEKGEPEQAAYAVEVFPKATENDIRPEPHTQEFAEYCEAAGWKFIDAKQKFCIFKKMDPDTADLFLPEERIANVRKGMISASAITLLILYGINALLQWTNLQTAFERNIFSSAFLFCIFIWSFMFLAQSFTLIGAVIKTKCLEAKIRSGNPIHIGNCSDGKYHLNMRDVYTIFLLLLLTAYFFAMNRFDLIVVNAVSIGITIGFSLLMNKLRPERDVYIVLQIGFCIVFFIAIVMSAIITFEENDNTDVPLLVSDYREWDDDPDDIDTRQDRNFLGQLDTVYIFGEKTSVSYKVYRSAHPGILERIWEEEFRNRKYNETVTDCTPEWNAQKAVRNQLGTYYVSYPNAVLILHEDTQISLTSEQICIICEKLQIAQTKSAD